MQAAWQQVAGSLTHAGIEDARREATIILQHATGRSPTGFYADLQRPLQPDEAAIVEGIVARRLHREPLQYIINSAHFYGREFYVAPAVLIPRPETELVIEEFRETAAARVRDADHPIVADVGTGSGAIAVTLACEFPRLHVLAIDTSRPALDVAARNASRHAVRDRVCLLQADLMSSVVGGLDAVVANLPYIRSGDIAGLSPEVSLFEPRVALDGGPDGLAVIARLCRQASLVLDERGLLVLEVGDGQAKDVLALLEREQMWREASAHRDLSGIDRVVTARRSDRPG